MLQHKLTIIINQKKKKLISFAVKTQSTNCFDICHGAQLNCLKDHEGFAPGRSVLLHVVYTGNFAQD